MTDWGPFSVKGKRVLVTGGAMGIGWGIVKRFLEGDAHVMIADIDKQKAKENVETLQEDLQARVSVLGIDITQENAPDTMISEMEKVFGGIDVLVNNAGIYPIVPFQQLTPEILDKVYSVNLKALIFASKAVVSNMIEKKVRGKIINIASIDSLHPCTNGITAYSSTKAGVWMFTKALAREVAKFGINVNAIAPGGIITEGVLKTATTIGQEESEKMMNEFVSRILIGRMGSPDDVANVAVFLASPASDYITGTMIVVDGGFLIS